MPEYLSTNPWEGVLEDAGTSAGLPSQLLPAIAQQENVNPAHNNPLGLSTDAGVMKLDRSEAIRRIYNQAQLLNDPNGPYRDFARTKDINALARVYSPPGAANDPYGTNVTEASGIKSALSKRYLSTDPNAAEITKQPEAAPEPTPTMQQQFEVPGLVSPTLSQEVGPPPQPSVLESFLKTKQALPNLQDLRAGKVITPSEPTLAASAPNLYNAAASVAAGFVPTTAGAIAGFATPAAQLPSEAMNLYGALKDWMAGKPLDEIVPGRFPESQGIKEAEKTPPFSEERYKAGFEDVAQLLMGKAITKGLATGAALAKQPELAKPTLTPEQQAALIAQDQTLAPADLSAAAERTGLARPVQGPGITPPSPETGQVFQEEPPPPLTPEQVAKIGAEIPTPEEVTPSASEITSPERVLSPQVRTGVAEEAPLRQSGQVAPARTGQQEQQPSQEVALVGMRPALRLGDTGPPDAVGNQGQTHADVITQNPEIGAEITNEKSQHGFELNGRFLSRSEAASQLGVKGDLTSQELARLQAQRAPTEPVAQDVYGSNVDREPVGTAGQQPPQPGVPASVEEVDQLQERAAGGPAGQPGAVPATPSEEVVGPSHEALTGTYGPEAIQRGQVLEPEELSARGRQDVASGRIDPYKVASKVTSGGAVTPRELGAIVAEHENLARDAIAKGKAAAAKPTPENRAAYEEARQKAEDYAVNVVKPAGTQWGELGRGLKQTARIDPSTEVGLRNAAITRLGRELTAAEGKKVRAIYDRTVKPSATKADKAMDNLSKKIDARTKGVKTPTEQEMGKLLKDIKDKLTPCR